MLLFGGVTMLSGCPGNDRGEIDNHAAAVAGRQVTATRMNVVFGFHHRKTALHCLKGASAVNAVQTHVPLAKGNLPGFDMDIMPGDQRE